MLVLAVNFPGPGPGFDGLWPGDGSLKHIEGADSMSMEEQEHQQEVEGPEREASRIKRHRWTAMWNGVVIGMGAFMIIGGFVLGIIPLIMGIGLEVMHRRRLERQQNPPE